MENSVPLFLALGVIILAARLAGTLTRTIDQPRVLGELVIGVILGPTLLDLLHVSSFGLKDAHLQETINQLAEIGVLLLMFKIGLDIQLNELIEVGSIAILAGAAGALLPILITMPIVLLFDYGWQPALFAGVTLAATSVSISAQVLLELGVLQTKEGSALLAAALVDDVLAILLLSLAVGVTGAEGDINISELIMIILRMAAYIGIAFFMAWVILPRVITWISHHPELSASYGVQGFALVMAFLFGWSAEYLGGVAPITGAFIAGLGISQARGGIKRLVDDAAANIAYPFLVPIFFISVGLHTDLSRFPLDAIPLAILLLIAAVLTKIIGSGVGAQLAGFTRLQALRLGVCMISRGEVGLIIASLGVSKGIFDLDAPLFASLFLVILLTTMLTPPLVRQVFRLEPAPIASGKAHHG